MCWPQEKLPEGEFVAGPQVTHGDLAIYCILSMLRSGWMDGEMVDRGWGGGKRIRVQCNPWGQRRRVCAVMLHMEGLAMPT